MSARQQQAKRRQQQARSLRASGMKLRLIATEMGITISAVWHALYFEPEPRKKQPRNWKSLHWQKRSQPERDDRDCQFAFRTMQRYRSFDLRIRGLSADGRMIPHPALHEYEGDWS